MFSKFKNMDDAFQQVRLLALCVILVAGMISGLSIWLSYRYAERGANRIYLLSSGKVLEALASSRRDNLAVEARDHIRVFEQLFFGLEPDEKLIAAHMARAFYLADGSAKKLADNLKESGFLTGIISGNVSEELQVDSVALDFGQYPYAFVTMGTETLTRTTTVTTRTLVARGWLREVERSDNNPHGFLIERFEVMENKDLNVKNK
jgi:conjugative transposon TraK protein